MSLRILTGDCRDALKTLPGESVHCAFTSPPYFRQRDYGVPGQIGQESEPAELAEALCEVAREVRRVLRADGTFWLQMGDTYAAGGNGGGGSLVAKRRQWTGAHARKGWRRQSPGFKEKDITLTPFVVADLLRADGWYLRGTIIWDKVVATEPPRLDRPSTAHEYLFLLAKSERYSVRDPGEAWFRSTVWSIRPQPTNSGHPAEMPEELARRCIVCSTRPGDVVPVRDLLHPEGGRVFLWITAPLLHRIPEIAQAWRLRYSSAIPWIKLWPAESGLFVYASSVARGTGFEVMGNAEYVVILKAGRPHSIKGRPFSGVWLAPRREHSRKPPNLHEEIEARIPGPYLEVFARASRAGWDAAGNELGKFDAAAAAPGRPEASGTVTRAARDRGPVAPLVAAE